MLEQYLTSNNSGLRNSVKAILKVQTRTKSPFCVEIKFYLPKFTYQEKSRTGILYLPKRHKLVFTYHNKVSYYHFMDENKILYSGRIDDNKVSSFSTVLETLFHKYMV